MAIAGLTFSQPNNVKYDFNPPKTAAPSATLNLGAALQSGGLKLTSPQGQVLDASTSSLPQTSGGARSSSQAIPTNIVPQPNSGEIDNLFNSSYDYLGQAESTLRNNFPSVLAEADATFNTNKGILDTNQQTATNTLNQQSTQASTRAQEALAANRRLYSDLNRGYQQRFGGASSAGQAASEIANVEQQRQTGDVYRGLQDTMQTINNQKTQIEGEYRNNILQLEQQKQLAVSNANRDFQNKLLEISKARADLGMSKAQANLQALQEYRNKVFQINYQNMQYQQTLNQQKEQANSSIQHYLTSMNQGLNTTGTAFNNFTAGAGNTNPTTNLQVGAGQPSAQASQYTGQIGNQTAQRQIIGYDSTGNPIYSQ